MSLLRLIVELCGAPLGGYLGPCHTLPTSEGHYFHFCGKGALIEAERFRSRLFGENPINLESSQRWGGNVRIGWDSIEEIFWELASGEDSGTCWLNLEDVALLCQPFGMVACDRHSFDYHLLECDRTVVIHMYWYMFSNRKKNDISMRSWVLFLGGIGKFKDTQQLLIDWFKCTFSFFLISKFFIS